MKSVKICDLIDKDVDEADKYERRFKYLIGRKEGLQFALDKAKGILPL